MNDALFAQGVLAGGLLARLDSPTQRLRWLHPMMEDRADRARLSGARIAPFVATTRGRGQRTRLLILGGSNEIQRNGVAKAVLHMR